MGDQFNTTLDLINLSFFGELAFKIGLLLRSQLLSNTVKPFINGHIVGI